MIYQEWCLVGGEEKENVSMKADDYAGEGFYIVPKERATYRKLRLVGMTSLDNLSVMLLNFRLLRI